MSIPVHTQYTCMFVMYVYVLGKKSTISYLNVMKTSINVLYLGAKFRSQNKNEKTVKVALVKRKIEINTQNKNKFFQCKALFFHHSKTNKMMLS